MDRLNRIRELFLKLHAGFVYMNDNPNKPEVNEGLILRAKPFIKELEGLGVHETFSLALLIMGPYITDSLINQFKE